ncbi:MULTISPECIES: DUF6463 family protein [Thalassotalea]|uniref:DUF6463 family protein n=1 Tax=Thalassotalea TaxID=1518149 RepID=UPI0015881111|nr:MULTISPECIES: DUF6463 family protein [Thalassotalea]
MKIMQYSGYYLLATGILHNIIGLSLGWSSLVAMHQDGWFFSTLVNNQMAFDREAISWFLITGCFWMLFGLMLQKALNEGYCPPLSLGWGFVFIGVIVAVIMPISGAYLFIIQGAILIIGTTKRKQPDSKITTAPSSQHN